MKDTAAELASRVRLNKKYRWLILSLVLLLVCVAASISAIRWILPPYPCVTKAQAGDTIYPIIPLAYLSGASEIPLGEITLPQSMRHFGCEQFMWQGGITSLWFEMDSGEFDQFLTTNAVEYPSNTAMRIPDFGPIHWKRPKSAYRFIGYDTEHSSVLISSYMWIDEVRGGALRVYIQLWY